MGKLLNKAKSVTVQATGKNCVYTPEQLELIFAIFKGEVSLQVGMRILHDDDEVKFPTSNGRLFEGVKNHAFKQAYQEGLIEFKI